MAINEIGQEKRRKCKESILNGGNFPRLTHLQPETFPEIAEKHG